MRCIIRSVSKPNKSNLTQPKCSKCLNDAPSTQGVCSSPRALIRGIRSAMFSDTITPPACRPIALFCLNSTPIGSAISGCSVISCKNIGEYCFAHSSVGCKGPSVSIPSCRKPCFTSLSRGARCLLT